MKCHQAIRKLNLRHMATHTIRGRDRTPFLLRRDGRDSLFLRGVTSQALRIIETVIGDQIAVWVMTRDAADSGIGTVETFAVCQPVRLKAHVHLTLPAAPNHRFPRSVTLPTEV